ncbi:hypothetical protein [Marinitenerispora sediminis]|uniref:hypothetical protein n=1 Tax=Marinitenerispora sediminis TaxID=1931232 RepID=UPI0015F1BE8E|nr:hypothetical protein [Marinitenerispora sediminis]
MERPPTRAEVIAVFEALLAGTIDRDQADRWAARRFDLDTGDPAVEVALDRLHGVDLAHGPDGPYLHDDGQVAAWLAELRAAAPPGPAPPWSEAGPRRGAG